MKNPYARKLVMKMTVFVHPRFEVYCFKIETKNSLSRFNLRLNFAFFIEVNICEVKLLLL